MDKKYDYWLCSIDGVGNATIAKLLLRFGDARGVYEAKEEALSQVLKPSQLKSLLENRTQWDLDKAYERLLAMDLTFLLREEAAYPGRLLEIPDAPYGLFYRGRLPQEELISVAIIGARDCSEYGRYVAEALGKCMGECGIQVISGMARGIDGISQAAALEAGGISFGVLGSGVDVCYPAQNRPLYEKLVEQGGILSSYPPGTLPRPQNFPPRNRIVSGLADAVVVIEAREKSGTLITVDMALEQGREVYVVPGRITDRLSDGCNRLLAQGASLLLSPQDFARQMQELSQKQRVEPRPITLKKRNCQPAIPLTQPTPPLPPEQLLIYQLLDYTPQSVPTLREKLRLRHNIDYTISQLNALLMRLTLTGAATQVSPGQFLKKGM